MRSEAATITRFAISSASSSRMADSTRRYNMFPKSKILHPLCKRAEQQSILYVFIIVDAHDEASSIYNIKSTNYVTKNGQRKLIIQRYLEDFPFPYYIVIKEFAELNKPLVNVIR
jgi:midasin